MKKYLSTIICAVLIIVSILINIDTNKITFGAGNGTNEKIESAEEVSELLNSFLYKNYGAKLASTSDEDDIEVEEITRSTKYESATIEISTKCGINADSSVSYKEGPDTVNSISLNMDRKMTCYFTEDSAYYITEATIYQRNNQSSKDDESTSSFIKIKAEMYFSEKSYMKISEFYTSVSMLEEANQIIGKWINLDYSIASSIISVNQKNYEQLSIIGNYTKDKENFNRSGNVYNMKDDISKELCCKLIGIMAGDVVGDFLNKTSFKLDLTQKTKPRITISYVLDGKDFESNDYYSSRVNASGSEYTILNISNVNNTVVKFPSNIEVYDIEDLID